MTSVPEDIRKKALTVFWKLADHYEATKGAGTAFWSDEATPALIAQALLDERERCAKIAASHYNTTHSHQARFAGANIASAIRSQASPSKPAQGTH